MPHRLTISKRLKRLRTKHCVSLTDWLPKESFISLTTDVWSDIKGRSYLVLTGHFIDNKLQLKSTVLRFFSFSSRHLSANIRTEIENQLDKLKVFDKVPSFTCDGAPDMIKMFDYLSRPDISRIRCQAHSLHLIVCNGLSFWVTRGTMNNNSDDGNAKYRKERLSLSLRKVNTTNAADRVSSRDSTDEEDIENNLDDIEEISYEVR